MEKNLELNVDIVAFIVDYGGIFLLTSISLSLLEFLIRGRVSGIPILIGFATPLILYLVSLRSSVLKPIFNGGAYRGSVKTLIATLIVFILYVLFLFTPVWIFPGNPSGDFYVYTSIAYRFLGGEATVRDLFVMHPIIYPFLGSVLSLFQGFTDNPILVTRLFMMILAFYSIPLIHQVSGRLYGAWAGEVSIILTLLINTFWYIVVVVTGLYANFLGIILTLYLILLIIRFRDSRHPILVPLLFIASATALLAHESTFLFLTGLWLAAVYGLFKRDTQLMKIAIIVSSPLIFFLLFSLHDLNVIYIFLTEYVFKLRPFTVGATRMEAIDPIADQIYQYSPFLSSIYRYVSASGLLVSIATMVVGAYLVYKRGDALSLVPWFWFLSIWIFTLFFLDIWRFSLLSMYPVCIFMGSVNRWPRPLEDWLGRVASKPSSRKIIKIEVVILLILLVFASSPLFRMTLYSLATRNYDYSKQLNIYDSMVWIRENTPEDAIVISIGRWEYMYTSLIANRTFYGDFFKYPEELYPSIQGLVGDRDIYVVVWNRLLDLDNERPIVEYYREDSRFQVVYYNEEVTIFKAGS